MGKIFNFQANLAKKMIFLVAFGLVASMTITATMSIWAEKKALEQSFESMAATTNELLAKNIAEAVRSGETGPIDLAFLDFLETRGDQVHWIAVFDDAGELVSGILRSPPDEAEARALIEPVIGSIDSKSRGFVFVDNSSGFPIADGGGRTINGVLTIGWNDSAIRAKIVQEARNVVLVDILIAALILGACYWRLTAIVIKPLKRIETIMGTLSAGQTDLEIPGTDRNDEIGNMARSAEKFRIGIVESNMLRERQDKLEEEQNLERQTMLSELDQSVGIVVSEAKIGHFDQRVTKTFDEDAFNNIGKGVNDICHNISDFLDDLHQSVGALANGDLTHRMNSKHTGKFGEMSELVNSSLSNLAQLIDQLSVTGSSMTEKIAVSAKSARELSQQTEQQAASLEETAAAMEEMRASVASNDAQADNISSNTSEAQKRAQTGREVVTGAVAAMADIENSSNKVTEIIAVIDGIAFQTNLLALNAAVEAARAGDAGKGFAVVASEVRTLAQRSSEAANDIKNLIEASQQKVSDGSKLVHATGDALGTIIESIETIAGQIEAISAATKEQSQSVSEITAVIVDLDQNTQRNATFADSSASTAQSLAGKAEELQKLVDVFKSQSDADIPKSEAA